VVVAVSGNKIISVLTSCTSKFLHHVKTYVLQSFSICTAIKPISAAFLHLYHY